MRNMREEFTWVYPTSNRKNSLINIVIKQVDDKVVIVRAFRGDPPACSLKRKEGELITVLPVKLNHFDDDEQD